MNPTSFSVKSDFESFDVAQSLDDMRLGSMMQPTIIEPSMIAKRSHRRKRAGEKTQRRRMLRHWKAWQSNDHLLGCLGDCDEVCFSQQMMKSPERLSCEACRQCASGNETAYESSDNAVISPVEAHQLNNTFLSEDSSEENSDVVNNSFGKSRRSRHRNRPYVVLRPRTVPAPRHPSQDDMSYSSEESDAQSYYSFWDANQESSFDCLRDAANVWEDWPEENNSRIPRVWSDLPEEDQDDIEDSLAELPNSELIQRIHTMSSLLMDRSTTEEDSEKDELSTLLEELRQLRAENAKLKEDNDTLSLKQNTVYPELISQNSS